MARYEIRDHKIVDSQEQNLTEKMSNIIEKQKKKIT